MCSHFRGSGGLVHAFDWITHHSAIGFDAFLFSDRSGDHRSSVAPYVDRGIAIYRHVPMPQHSHHLYAYDQVFEMELCRWRLKDYVQWIGYWDMDEWFRLPAFPVQRACVQLEPVDAQHIADNCRNQGRLQAPPRSARSFALPASHGFTRSALSCLYVTACSPVAGQR
jgi:hypothetical protein